MVKSPPQIFFIATPIGNLSDISTRAISTLKEVDLIAAEDTRHTAKLLSHYKIKTPLKSYHDHNEKKTAKMLIGLCQNKDYKIAVVSDAGTPGINDPGFRINQEAKLNDITTTCIPGPSSVTAAISLSAVPINQFGYLGFLPKSSTKRTELYDICFSSFLTSFIFLDTPHQIYKSLNDLKSFCDLKNQINGQVQIFRELTKQYEQVELFSFDQLIKENLKKQITPKGELVGILYFDKKRTSSLPKEIKDIAELDKIKEDINIFQKIPSIKKEALYSFLKEKYHLKKREIFALLLHLKQNNT